MEIISQVNNIDDGTYLIIVGVVALVIGVAGIVLDVIFDNSWATVAAVTGCLVASVLLLAGLHSKSRGIEYIIRVDNITTVSNLVDRYEIVSYDKDTDTWLVRDKEP
ncbi:MAG: hypothetical protein IJE78_06235 [Bacteroidaceae bacterium]|nr:hypothetical protein [Bacteroidaceae bacterium]